MSTEKQQLNSNTMCAEPQTSMQPARSRPKEHTDPWNELQPQLFSTICTDPEASALNESNLSTSAQHFSTPTLHCPAAVHEARRSKSKAASLPDALYNATYSCAPLPHKDTAHKSSYTQLHQISVNKSNNVPHHQVTTHRSSYAKAPGHSTRPNDTFPSPV